MPKHRSKNIYFFLACFLILGVNISMLAQAEIPKKPEVQTSVYDQAKMLSGNERLTLEQKLINYADTTSTQIVVATINNLQGEDIAFYATKWAHEWGIGQAQEDNGIFILVAKDDRKITIQTGYGVEHLLTDALSKRIIENFITPQFKQGNFYKGLDEGTSVIMQIMSGEYQGSRQESTNGDGIPFIFIIIFFIVLMIILSKISRGRGGRGGGRKSSMAGTLLEAIILSKAGRGGFGGGGGFGGSSGGGSFGGGGFGGGFGGGGFGGGGASGGW